MRPIDADELRIKILNGAYWDNQDEGVFLDMVDSMPTLDEVESNEPLTFEQLRRMDGQPVWVEDIKHWALIDIEKGGQWDGMPFATWQENGVRFCYNVINRKLLCYRRPPEKKEGM